MVSTGLSQFFMLILCVLAGPPDAKEFRIDALRTSGSVLETFVVRRTDTGFALVDPDSGAGIGSIKAAPGKPGAYVLKIGDGSEQIYDLNTVIPDFKLAELQTGKNLELKTSGGEKLQVKRSGGVTYLLLPKSDTIYASH